MSAVTEKRRFARAPVSGEARLFGEGWSQAGRLADLSLGGVFVATSDPLPVGGEVRLELRLETGIVEARAAARWARASERPEEPSGNGFQFLEIRPEDQDLIQQYVLRAPRADGGVE